jgi:putative oxidoreductase
LLSSLFIWAGYGKLTNLGATLQEFTCVGAPAPGLMIWVSIAIELVGGLVLLVGFTTRWIAGILALWCLATAFAVHLGTGMHCGRSDGCPR